MPGARGHEDAGRGAVGWPGHVHAGRSTRAALRIEVPALAALRAEWHHLHHLARLVEHHQRQAAAHGEHRLVARAQGVAMRHEIAARGDRVEHALAGIGVVGVHVAVLAQARRGARLGAEGVEVGLIEAGDRHGGLGTRKTGGGMNWRGCSRLAPLLHENHRADRSSHRRPCRSAARREHGGAAHKSPSARARPPDALLLDQAHQVVPRIHARQRRLAHHDRARRIGRRAEPVLQHLQPTTRALDPLREVALVPGVCTPITSATEYG